MKAVSNTGPLIAFAKLHRLDLLTALFERLIIPTEVQHEVHAGVQKNHSHSLDISAMIEKGQIQVLSARPSEIKFERKINLGEVGAVRIALQESADFVLIDDRSARVEAARLGLKVKGTVGVILLAMEHKLISESEAIHLLEAIMDRPDIWVSQDVVQAAIAEIKKGSQVG